MRPWNGKDRTMLFKLYSWEGAKQVIGNARAKGKRIVFTNGCFDLLHAGHVYLLEQAWRQGDFLVVGLNSDASVRENKGSSRPVMALADRACMLSSLSCVDAIVTFNEPTPARIIEYLAPDVLVKGGDYDPLTLVGGDFVRKRGGEVVIVPLLPGFSTTAVIEHIEQEGTVQCTASPSLPTSAPTKT